MDRSFPIAIEQFAAGDTNIFWDLDDYSILDGLDPFSIYQTIKSALEIKGYRGPLSIQAYVDEDTLPAEFMTKYVIAGIHIVFVPKGDTSSRVGNMMRDIISQHTYPVNRQSTLVVLSKDTMFDLELSAVRRYSSYNVVIASIESLVGRGIPIGQKRIDQPNQIVIVISGTSGVNTDDVINRLLQIRNGLHLLSFISKREICDSIANGKDVVVRSEDIDKALDCRGILRDSAAFVFLVAESDLDSDAVKSEESLLSLARKEFSHLHFDYIVVVNAEERLDDAVKRLESIIIAEKCKVNQRTRY